PHRGPCSTRFPYTTLFRSAPSVGVPVSKQCNAPQGRGYNKDSRKQAAHLLSFEDAFDADCHGRGAMRNFVRFGAFDHLGKRMLRSEEHTSELQSRVELVCR